MVCNNCGQKDENNSQFCMKCGQPLQAGVSPGEMPEGKTPQNSMPPVQGVSPRRKRALPIAIAISAVLLVVIILVLALSANPVAGRWYSQSGTELIFLKNGEGFTVPAGEAGSVYFVYAIGYREPGYIKGEIYEKENGTSTWFYLYDGKLEYNGESFYRQNPSRRLG